MTVHVVRTQYPVGQGFFHVCSFHGDNWERIATYVYDCGAMGSYSTALAASVTASIVDTHRIDLLFISHFHDDHIRGLRQLASYAARGALDTVVIPLTSPKDRLITFAQNVANRRRFPPFGPRPDESFIIDPVRAAYALGASNVIVVGSGNGRAPGAIDDDTQDPDSFSGPFSDAATFPEMVEVEWAKGQEDTERNWGFARAPKPGKLDWDKGDHTTTYIRDDNALVVRSEVESLYWQLSPYVDKVLADREDEFLVALAARIGIRVEDLKRQIVDPAFMRMLVLERKKDVVASYRTFVKAGGNINRTSLSLLSIPRGKVQGRLRWSFRRDVGGSSSRFGWFGTGDAELADNDRRTRLLGHFEGLLSSVHTFALPHHGSDHIFSAELVDVIQPEMGVVGADRYRGWVHPGAAATTQFAKQQIPLHRVSSRSGTLVEHGELTQRP